MSARQALASFTTGVADMFLQMAAKMAANQIILSILKAFASGTNFGGGWDAVSYTHLTLPTTPYV